MPFAAPLALLGLLFLPVVVAMYLLKLRRDESVVSSTLLWQRLVADVARFACLRTQRNDLEFVVIKPGERIGGGKFDDNVTGAGPLSRQNFPRWAGAGSSAAAPR